MLDKTTKVGITMEEGNSKILSPAPLWALKIFDFHLNSSVGLKKFYVSTRQIFPPYSNIRRKSMSRYAGRAATPRNRTVWDGVWSLHPISEA